MAGASKHLFLRINHTLADTYLYFSNRLPQSTAQTAMVSSAEARDCLNCLTQNKTSGKIPSHSPWHPSKGEPLTSNTKSHIPVTKRKQKRTQSKWLFCWQISCSIATAYTQLTKPTGYSGGLGQAFNILLFAISTVGSLDTNRTEENGLVAFPSWDHFTYSSLNSLTAHNLNTIKKKKRKK